MTNIISEEELKDLITVSMADLKQPKAIETKIREIPGNIEQELKTAITEELDNLNWLRDDVNGCRAESIIKKIKPILLNLYKGE